jgi:hypothetical protein
MFSLIGLSSMAAWMLGIVEQVYEADVTKLSFFIYLIFIKQVPE